MNEPKFVVYDKSETILDSWAKDAVTFGFLFLCIYASQDSTWWNFVTGCSLFYFSQARRTLSTSARRSVNSKEALKIITNISTNWDNYKWNYK